MNPLYQIHKACLLFAVLAVLGGQLAAGQMVLSQSAVEKTAEEYSAASNARVGIVIIDLASGATVAAVRPGEQFMPASNQKVLTSAFAMSRLGENFNFTTSVHLVGSDIHVVGSGDPAFGDPTVAASVGASIYDEFDRWTQDIRREMGTRIDGDIVVHSTFTRDQAQPLESFRHPDWPKNQHHNWFVAPVTGLNYHNNCFDVIFVSRAGTIAPVVTPASRFISIQNRTSAGSKHVWSLRSNADDSVLTVQGTVRSASNSPLSVAADHPPLMAGRVLAERLVLGGVDFRGKVRYATQALPAESKCLSTSNGPLSVALAVANKRSINMAAESMFLRAGDGTWAGSARIMKQVLVKDWSIDPADIEICDGSGLSRRNRITPRAMAGVLGRFTRRDDYLAFAHSLAVSGVDGTLSDRLTGAFRAKVVAKTGYILGVSCLSGYALDWENRPRYAFCILANNVPGGQAWRTKNMQDELCRMMVAAAAVRK